MNATREPLEPDTHLATLLALGAMVVGVRRPAIESWFVLLTGLATGTLTVVRVDA